MLIESYDSATITVLDIYMEDATDITLVEFGRGNGALAKKYLDKGKKVTIIEDFKQQIYQADWDNYSDYKDITIPHNVLSTEGWDDIRHKTDLIFCSLPFVVPTEGDMSPIDYQDMLNRTFYELSGLLRKPGRIITVDYNTPQIREAVAELNLSIDPLIDQGDGNHYMASVSNQIG